MRKFDFIKKGLAALIMLLMCVSTAMAVEPVGPFCVEIQSVTRYERPFKLYATQVLQNHYQLNGTHKNGVTGVASSADGSALISDEGKLSLTLRSSESSYNTMTSLTYHFEELSFEPNGSFKSIFQSSSGATIYDSGDAILVDCDSEMTSILDIDNDGDGFTENQGDCDDADPTSYPGGVEICGDGIDQNCYQGDLACPLNVDADGDGFTTAMGDCNDSNATIHPLANDLCGDGIDQDCSGADQDCGPTSRRYTNHYNGTVTDIVTGLKWQQDESGEKYTFAAALDYCEDLVMGGTATWRLPILVELAGIVKEGVNPSIDPIFYEAVGASYWSSTIDSQNTDVAWNVSFITGYKSTFPKTVSMRVRCVSGTAQ